MAEASARNRDRIARGDSVDRLRHVGSVRVRADPRALCAAAVASRVRHVPLVGGLVSGPPVGIGILSAGIILAIMIIPFIAAVMRDVFEVTPALLKESAYGLGSTTWEVVWKVVLPFTKAGVVGGIMLGLGRALGETMAVTFVIGNFNQLDTLVALRSRQFDYVCACQRVRGGHSRPARSVADLSRTDPVLHHVRRAVAVQVVADADAPQRGHPDMSAVPVRDVA